MTNTSILFWQPRKDYLNFLSRNKLGKAIIVTLNYLIWIFFFYISYLLIRTDIRILWQLFFATLFSEIIERYLKKKNFWCRPMFNSHDSTPVGLVDSWYKTGSFPSGHSIKSAFFFLFILQYQVFSPLLFVIITGLLLLFRVLMGFHYLIDIFGGFVIGIILWVIVHSWQVNTSINSTLQNLFNFVFRVN